MHKRLGGILGLLLAAMAFGGCLLVRSTEHRIRLDPLGSGDALIRLVDIRSDAEADSAVTADFDAMMKVLRDSAITGFESRTRRITAKQLLLSGDTLKAEIAYDFDGYGDLEGMQVNDEAIFVNVPPERVVVKTNGKVEKVAEGGYRIVWERDASRLMYEIAERFVRPSTSLARMYRAYLR
jgi:hypothetical protein